MSIYPSFIELSALDGSNGFRINGAAPDELSGASVSGAGDINGDGFADLIIGAFTADANGAASGSAFAVFGSSSGFASSIELSDVDGADGFRVNGEATKDHAGRSVAGAGDINGDGFADLIVGAYYASPNGSYSGASYVVFGKAGSFPNIWDLSALNGSNGFRINGETAHDYSGSAVAGAGDVNGDGLADIIIGAKGAGSNGGAYIVFGAASGFSPQLELSALDGTNWFQLNGAGKSVASAGDINGDGLADVVVGASALGFGTSYVVFGSNAGFSSSLELSALSGSDGFKISGDATSNASGYSVGGAGDVNGDGIVDMIIGAPGASPHGMNSGASYVLFGKTAGFASNIDLSSLGGANGFKISGEGAGDNSGVSVDGAGDVNGDGFDDLIIGAFHASPNGNYSGASYVVFGKASGFAANINLSALNGNTGFQINGVATGDISGVTVAGAGDINGDGFDDIVVGAPDAYLNGAYSGASYVIYGSKPGMAVSRAGTAIANTIHGGDFNDTLSGLGGNDTLIGHGGKDTLIGGPGADSLDGGPGADTADYAASSTGVSVDLGTHHGSGGLAAGDSYIRIENVSGSSDNDSLTGNGSANALRGQGGDDTLIGAGDNDTLLGQGGNDRLIGGRGLDALKGGSGDDSLLGQGGNDKLIGGGGDDTLNGGGGSDNLNGGAGNDALIGGSASDSMTGGSGDDVLNGGGGNDTMLGGAGRDILIGKAGNDVFDFNKVSDSAPGLSHDRIRDFTKGTDHIDLSGIDAIAGVAGSGNDAFHFIGVSGFSHTAGELRAFASGGHTMIKGDVDGDGVADLQIELLTSVVLAAGDFML